jgi:AcrR family transcriptional regulator
MNRAKRSKPSAASVRDRILDVAGEHLGIYGFSRMTVEDIAREVGIGKGTIYLHFRSKEELVLAQIDRLVDTVLSRLREIAESDASASDALRLMLVDRVRLRWESVKGYRRSLAELLSAIRPALLERRVAHFAAEMRVFQTFLSKAHKTGALTMADPAATAEALVYATNSLLPFTLSVEETGNWSTVERRVMEIANLAIAGMAPPTAGRPKAALPRKGVTKQRASRSR